MKAATVFSLVLVIAATGFFSWLAAAVLSGSVRGDKAPGRLFMLLIADWDSASGAFKGLGVIVSFGIAYVGTYQMKDWLFYAIVACSALGLFMTGYLFFEVTSVTTAQRFWAYSPSDKLQDYQSFVTAARVGLGVFCAWFVSVIAAEVGAK